MELPLSPQLRRCPGPRLRRCPGRCLALTGAVLALIVVTGRSPAAAASWVWPLPPPHQVLAGFAPPAHDWLPGHRGVDLAAVLGEPVVAAGAGRVSFAGRIGGVDVVAVRHAGGLETTYEPVRAAVRAGAVVGAGDRLGVVSGRLAHCDHDRVPRVCLHWGLRRGAAYLDPLALIGAHEVRLLPMLTRSADGAWVLPAVGGASAGSSAVALGWTVAAARRRRRPRLPPGVSCLDTARATRRGRVSRACR